MNDQEQPDRDPYEPEINDRGMAYMPALDGIGGEAVRVHDSSLAGTDAVWLYIDTTAGDKIGAQLPFGEAFKLASQIYTLAERRGYPVPAPLVPRTRRDVNLGDTINVTEPDGSQYPVRINTIREDGTFTVTYEAPNADSTHVLAPGVLTFDTEYPPAPGDIIRYRLDSNGGVHTARVNNIRADGSIEVEVIEECQSEERFGGILVTHVAGCDGIQCGHSTVVPNNPQPLVTQIDPNTDRFERVDGNIAALADRLEYLERCYREVPRPQDVGMMAAHLAKIERLESELAEARREINAHKDVLGQVGAEKRKLEAQLEAHHQHDADPRRAVDIVKVNRDLTRQLHEAQRELGGMRDRERAVDMVLESVVDGKLALTEPVDPETPAGRVRDLVAVLLQQAHDAIAEFVSRQCVEYRKHSAEALKEDVKLAAAMGVPLERLYDPEDVAHVRADLNAEAADDRVDAAAALANVEAAVTAYERGDNPLEIGLPDGTLAVRIALALHNNRQRIAELEHEMTAITDHVADLAGGDDDDTPLTRVRAAIDTVVMRANGYVSKLRQTDVVMNKFAEGDDPHVLPLEIGSVPARVAEFLARERYARQHPEVGEPAHTVTDTSHYFGLALEGEETDE